MFENSLLMKSMNADGQLNDDTHLVKKNFEDSPDKKNVGEAT